MKGILLGTKGKHCEIMPTNDHSSEEPGSIPVVFGRGRYEGTVEMALWIWRIYSRDKNSELLMPLIKLLIRSLEGASRKDLIEIVSKMKVDFRGIPITQYFGHEYSDFEDLMNTEE